MSVMLTSARSGMHKYDATNCVPRRSAVARASCGPMNLRGPPVRTSEMARPGAWRRPRGGEAVELRERRGEPHQESAPDEEPAAGRPAPPTRLAGHREAAPDDDWSRRPRGV
jgi:hypothetical protein